MVLHKSLVSRLVSNILLLITIKNTFTKCDLTEPKLITKSLHITAYEDQTVILPCQVTNLPENMHIIWQYNPKGRLDHIQQTVLTIGKTLIENNYRLRVMTNESVKASTDHITSKMNLEDYLKVAVNNLQIRKLQIGDSGWYECQLPTKPTQKSYVHLEVYGVPRITINKEDMLQGDEIELTCHVNHLPINSTSLYWTLNGRRLEPGRVVENFSFHNTSESRRFIEMLQNRFNHLTASNGRQTKRHFIVKRFHENRRNFLALVPPKSHFTVFNNRRLNMTRLMINGVQNIHKGIYRCQYDKIETEYNLDRIISKDTRKGRLRLRKMNSSSKMSPASILAIHLAGLALLLRFY